MEPLLVSSRHQISSSIMIKVFSWMRSSQEAIRHLFRQRLKQMELSQPNCNWIQKLTHHCKLLIRTLITQLCLLAGAKILKVAQTCGLPVTHSVQTGVKKAISIFAEAKMTLELRVRFPHTKLIYCDNNQSINDQIRLNNYLRDNDSTLIGYFKFT